MTRVSLYLIAFQAKLIIRLVSWVAGFFPEKIGRWLIKLVAAGLEGLAALRDRRAAAELIIASALIAFLSVLTPYILFLAFGLPLGLAAAAALNLAILIGSLPSSAPANIGVFEFLTVVTLQQLGLANNSVLVSFAFVFHLIVIGPVLILGSIILARQEWPLHILQRRLAHATAKSSDPNE